MQEVPPPTKLGQTDTRSIREALAWTIQCHERGRHLFHLRTLLSYVQHNLAGSEPLAIPSLLAMKRNIEYAMRRYSRDESEVPVTLKMMISCVMFVCNPNRPTDGVPSLRIDNANASQEKVAKLQKEFYSVSPEDGCLFGFETDPVVMDAIVWAKHDIKIYHTLCTLVHLTKYLAVYDASLYQDISTNLIALCHLLYENMDKRPPGDAVCPPVCVTELLVDEFFLPWRLVLPNITKKRSRQFDNPLFCTLASLLQVARHFDLPTHLCLLLLCLMELAVSDICSGRDHLVHAILAVANHSEVDWSQVPSIDIDATMEDPTVCDILEKGVPGCMECKVDWTLLVDEDF